MTITQNVVNVDYHVSRYKKIVAELRTEVAELKEKLARGGGVAKVCPIGKRVQLLNGISLTTGRSHPSRVSFVLSLRKQRSHRSGLR